MKYKLKKCPFCGENARVFHIPENNKYENSEHPLWEWKFPGKYVVGCDTPLQSKSSHGSTPWLFLLDQIM